jgi:hypothetical protein
MKGGWQCGDLGTLIHEAGFLSDWQISVQTDSERMLSGNPVMSRTPSSEQT